MKYLLIAIIALLSANSMAYELCGENILIRSIENRSTDPITLGDVTIIDQSGRRFEWRPRYGTTPKETVNQVLSMAMFAKATETPVSIYCGGATQYYNAKYLRLN